MNGDFLVFSSAERICEPIVAAAESKVTLVYGQMNEPPGARARVGLTGLTVAECALNPGHRSAGGCSRAYDGTL